MPIYTSEVKQQSPELKLLTPANAFNTTDFKKVQASNRVDIAVARTPPSSGDTVDITGMDRDWETVLVQAIVA